MTPDEFTATIARMDSLDWERIALETTGSTDYASWCYGTARQQLAATVGFCQCCVTMIDRPPAPAVAVWTSALSRNRTYLCQSCLNHWQANAADDPALAGNVEHLTQGATA